ncbi:hypothetical protein MKX03_019375 [Papaver bracteatum]|nr:hypothetical protein MKX03_019375 [Papaver bracteatum]
MVTTSSSTWFFSYTTKLRFLTRIQKFFLRSRTTITNKQHYYSKSSENHYEQAVVATIQQGRQKEEEEEEEETMMMSIENHHPLRELIKIDEEMSALTNNMVLLKRSVKQLHFGSWEEKEIAAKQIKRLAKDNLKTRKSLVSELGVIPPLLSMLDSDITDRKRLAIQALIELANGTYTNKAVMVDSGILWKLPRNVDNEDEPTRHDFALLVLSLSSLANTQFPISSSEILPFLISILDSDSAMDSKKTCLVSLYNLSSMLDNVGPLVSTGLVNTLMGFSSDKEVADKALAILGNLVVTVMGKKAIENDSMVPECFIEIMTWEDKPKCQELSAYILMILAHQCSEQRTKMAQLGIVPVLLEVALLGSPLAQKWSLKILQWFKDERQTRIGAHSGPQSGIDIVIGSPINQQDMNEGKKIIKKMVKQSLDKNMESITRRANGGADSLKIKAYVISSSSKSLPY